MSSNSGDYQIVFQSASWVVVDKPSGWLTVPGRFRNEIPENCLGTQLSSDLNQRLWPVHRLDKEVSGLVLFAKNAQAHKLANHWFENREVTKTYEAWTPLVEGQAFPAGEVIWNLQLKRGKKRSFESPDGKEAITKAKTYGMFEQAGYKILMWRLNPLTGRSHQLRVSLAKHYAPIIGDCLYGADPEFGRLLSWRQRSPNSIGLRAVSLDFTAIDDDPRGELPPMISVKGLR